MKLPDWITAPVRSVAAYLSATRPQTAGYEPPPRYGQTWLQRIPPFSTWMAETMLTDHQVGFGLAIGSAPLYSAEVEVSGSPDIAQFVQNQWDQIWGAHAKQIFRAKYFGWAPFEAMYRRSEDGRLEFERLADRHPNDAWPLLYRGQVVGVRFRRIKSIDPSEPSHGSVDLFGPKALWVTHDADYGQRFGKSGLERAYPPWWERVMDGGATDLRKLRMCKDAWIGDVLRYPMGRNMTLPDGTQVAAREVAEEIVNLRASGGTLRLPSERDDSGNYVFDYTPPTGLTGATQIIEWIHELDWDIFDGLYLPREVVEAATTGSGFSGRSIPFVAFLSIRDVEFSDYVRQINEQIIKPLVWMNDGKKAAKSYKIQPRPLLETVGKQMGDMGQPNTSSGGPPGQVSQQGLYRPTTPQQPPVAQQFSVEPSGGLRWITIGVREKDGRQHAGGFPVQIDADGNIVKSGGPKGLVGKHVSQAGQHFKDERYRESRESDITPRMSWGQIIERQAKRHGIDPETYAQVADDVWSDRREIQQERENAKAYARKRLGLTAADINRLENQGFDSGSQHKRIKALDVVGREMASEFPSLAWGGGYDSGDDDRDHAALVWNLIREGKQDIPSRTSPEFHAEVDDYLNAQKKAAKQGRERNKAAADDFEFGANQFSVDANGAEHKGKGEGGGQFVGKGGRSKAADARLAKAKKQPSTGTHAKVSDLVADAVANPAKASGLFTEHSLANAEKLHAATNIDFAGYAHSMDGSAVLHTLNRHGPGNETRHDHFPVTHDDFQKVPSIIHSADEIFRLKDASGKLKIRYVKRVNGYFVVIEEERRKQGRLAFSSMRKVAFDPRDKELPD